jgi:WD40 repeat protein
MKTIVFAFMLLALTAGFAVAQDWAEIPGIATDIAVGSDGSVWIVGSESRGYLAFRWDDGAWVKAPRTHWMRIDAGPEGTVWAINRESKVFRWKNNDWQELAGAATDIAVGADGTVFIIGSESKGHRIYKWDDGAWSDFPGSNYKRVAVGPDGNPFVVSQDHKIYRWRNNAWQELAGAATDIAAGPDGELFIIGSASKGNNIYKWDEGAWTKMPGNDFRNLSVGPNGEAWATKGDDGKIFRLR